MKRQQGFTLIELVVVIIILGILGAVAVAKLTNLSPDAKTAIVLNLAGTIKSMNSLVYSKSVIAGNEDQQVSDPTNPLSYYVLNSSGERIYINKGYVLAQWDDALENLLDIDVVYVGDYVGESDRSKWSYRALLGGSGGEITFYPPGEMEEGSNCKVTYYNTGEDTEIEVETGDC
ncbi:MAG: type II secretion system protein [Shewanella sp.]